MADRNSKPKYSVTVDLGGARILAAVFRGPGDRRAVVKMSPKAERGVEAVLARIVRCVHDAIDEVDAGHDDVRLVVVGAPGPLSPDRSTILAAPAFGWHDVPLRKELESRLGLPVLMENDCNLAALAVYEMELDAKPASLVSIVLDAGVGAGIILDGALYRGFSHVAGELGHISLDPNGPKCRCGRRGCFEAFVGRRALIQRIKALVRSGRNTVLTDAVEDLDRLTPSDLKRAVKAGDRVTRDVLDTSGRWLGLGIATVANLINPAMIVLGGGLVEALGGDFFEIVREAALEAASPGALDGVTIRPSSLGEKACLVGGAVLARNESLHKR